MFQPLSRRQKSHPLEPGSAAEFTGTTWQWIGFTGPNEQIEVESPASYSLVFHTDGTLDITVDCNNAQGSYQLDGQSIRIQVGAMTKAMCAPGSRSNEFIRDLASAAIYFTQDGNLYIDLMADAGTMVFAPAETASRYVQGVFTRIAHRYDLMNRLRTGGQDLRWRKEVIRRARLHPHASLLDLGTGTGDLAREEYLFARREPPRLLHLATHGFFLDGSAGTPAGYGRGVGAIVSADAAATAPGGFDRLKLSALALAGANRRDLATVEDGILTAEEVAALDLSGVEWAVLSACDTGLGEIRSVAVAPEYRRRGLGSQLVRTCLEEAKVLGLSEVFLLTLRPDYFERFGFKVVPRDELLPIVWADCVNCVKFPDCDEIPMLLELQSEKHK